MAGRVFISHASEDREIADAVCEAIESRGLSCWIAPRDITPGKDYAQALYDAINECSSLVLVFSEHSNRSPQVRREVERAARDGDLIIPFRIDDTIPNGGLLFNVGNLDRLAPASVDLATQVGILAEIVQTRVQTGVVDFQGPVSNAETMWHGSPAVIRRVTATWMIVFLWILLVMAGLDLMANLDAYANAVYTRSLFAEADVAERVLVVPTLSLILLIPSVFIWLIWLTASFLTLEADGVEPLRFSARRVPGRFMWPGFRLEGGPTVVAALWDATARLKPSSQADAATGSTPPRWLALWWFLPTVLVGFSIATAVVGDSDEWATDAIVTLAAVTDLLWIVAGALSLYVVRVPERRMRRREADLAARSRRARPVRANTA